MLGPTGTVRVRAEEGHFIAKQPVGLTRTRVPTATPEDDRGEKAEPRRYALLTLILLFNVGLYGDRTYTRPGGLARGRA